ncbi:MAG: SPOR domain-containing protein [Ignavibacteriales bacterium]|nr:SPOR domain-containing protein [Ignavibacteriales bacterium]
MPDLNLMDEGGFEEAQTPVPAPTKKGGGGGGGVMKIVIIVVVLAVVGGGLWFANNKGWVKVPFLSKKQPVVAQIQEEYPQQPDDLFAADTADVSLLETPPVEEPKGKAVDAKKPPVKTGTPAEKSAASSEIAAMTSQQLSEMSGKYTIQVFALHDKKNAEDVVARLSEAGYPAYVEEIPMKDAMWYTVRIGKYPSRVDARKAVETFALELRSNYFIGRVKSN